MVFRNVFGSPNVKLPSVYPSTRLYADILEVSVPDGWIHTTTISWIK